MQPLEIPSSPLTAIARRIEILFAEHWRQVCKRADHLFAGLLIFQWLAGIAAAYWISPKTWVGQTSYTHLHVWAALFLGGAVISLPVLLAMIRPGATLTRHAIAVAQMLMSALLIHLTGGRIETHFHVFGSLALLAFYRDWRVLVSASAVVALDHLIRGLYFPQSVFGALTASHWRWLEHAGWVVFEDIFLIRSCIQSIREMRGIAEQQARLEATNESIEAVVLKRTAELQESQSRNATILESALDCIITFDSTGRIIEFNPAAEKTFGYEKTAVLGNDLAELLIPASRRTAHHQGMEHYLVAGAGAILGKRSEMMAMRADGSQFPVELAITSVGHAEPPMFTAYLQDITERKRTEKELQKAKEAAEAASRAKSDFLASMSHEIRTPMNGVIGMTGLLLDTPLTDEQREFAQIVQSSADSLLTIINDILDFSKIEAGKLTIEPVPFDLQQAIEEVAEILAARVEAKGLDLILRYDPAAPHHLVGDAGRLRQVLTNLAGNAIKFTHTGHIFINVECERQTDAEIWLRISVEDTGIGIPAEKLDHIFEKFTQADASTTRQYGGTGLGLAICTQLVELMGGQIGVDSSPGNGSTFWFRLCLPRHSEPLAPAPALASLKGVRVLIVDDNRVNRRVLHEQISSWGMRNGGFASGEEALVALRAAQATGDPYQIAILDYQMPGMDGEMLAYAIKADPVLQETVLVMLTSIGQLGEAERMKEAGFAAHLVKPARQAQLMNALTKVWAASLQTRSAESTACLLPTETPAARTALPAAIRPSIRAQVLVAEDNTINQKVAVRLLEKFGCQVDLAASGKEALQMSEILSYDIIFMDCQMPEMDGYEATAEIRRRKGAAGRVPIIAMTAHALKGDRERCLEAGMDDYISKPVKSEDFQQMLQQWVSRVVQAPDAASKLVEDQPPPVIFDDEAMARFHELADQLGMSFVDEILKIFLDTAPGSIAILRQVVSAGDARGLMEAAHALAGSCRNLGLRSMVLIAQELESIGRAQSVTGAEQLIDQLAHAFDRAQVEIETRLQPAFACLT